VNKKAATLQDTERDARNKLENSLKYREDQSYFSVSELANKISIVEDNVRREEKARVELREKLRVSEEQNREMVNFIKSIQTQGDVELSQMRQFLQEKLNEDHLTTIKSKEKSTVLFSEVVRLGQEGEKQIEYLQSLNQNFENRIQTLEARLASSEQNNVVSEKRGDMTQNLLNDVIEKLEGKVIGMEQNVHMMKHDQKKEKDNVQRLEISSLRYNEDFKNILG
jgi:hypothetical protein